MGNTVRTLNAESRTPSGDELLRLILAELRLARADRKRDELACALRRALEEEVGSGGFTVAELLEVARTEPENRITHVLADLVDPAQPERNRATQLGRLLGTLPWITSDGRRHGKRLVLLGRGGGRTTSPCPRVTSVKVGKVYSLLTVKRIWPC